MEPFRASYQGGVSEEFYIPMVGEHLVNELTLRKFLGEVEKILNDKPITPLSTDPPRFRRNRRRSVPQRCPKSRSSERAVTRCPREH